MTQCVLSFGKMKRAGINTLPLDLWILPAVYKNLTILNPKVVLLNTQLMLMIATKKKVGLGADVDDARESDPPILLPEEWREILSIIDKKLSDITELSSSDIVQLRMVLQ